jgi:hypothetical protein
MPPVYAVLGNFVHRSSDKFCRFFGYHIGIRVWCIGNQKRQQVLSGEALTLVPVRLVGSERLGHEGTMWPFRSRFAPVTYSITSRHIGSFYAAT